MTDDDSRNLPRRRIVMCMGPYCNASQRADRNAEILKPLLEEINNGQVPVRVTLEFSGCMNMCGAGPNWIIYPEGAICHQIVGSDDVRRVVDEHLRD